jgi:hypothetical protein
MGQYDVVLADIHTSWIVPTFGGKVVAALHPLAFVPDHSIRKADLKEFFSSAATSTERRRIIEKYNADYLLVNKLTLQHCYGCLLAFESLGKIVFQDQRLLLVSLQSKLLENTLSH